MEPGDLHHPPYTDYHPSGLDALFADAEAGDIVGILRAINRNAAWVSAGASG